MTIINDHTVSAVARVDIELGDLTFLDHDQVKMAYAVLTRGTVLEGSELDIRSVTGRVVCEECGRERDVIRGQWEIDDVVRCDCGAKLKIVQGRECRVVGIVAE